MSTAAIEIRELTTDLLPDYLHFFDHDAFADNPGWASCYCMEPHFTGSGEEWEARTGADNRAAVGELIGCGRARGLLAYVDGRPVGWCNAAPRSALAGYDSDPDYRFDGDDGDRIGAIACFVIAKPYRRHGIARRLLEAALAGFERRGLRIAEAYPRKEGSLSDASSYHGPLGMYLEAGFEPVRELEHQLVVRKPVGAGTDR